MDLPDTITDRLPFLDALENDWQPVARWALVAWLIFYLLFLYQALRGHGPLLMIDVVIIPIHEGGHLLFRWFGQWLAIAGGTFLQLFAPFALTVYFVFQRHVTGTAFCAFFFFEQFLPIATYMADARAQALPLLTVGDGSYVIHDWNYLFSSFGVLNHDTQIATTVRALGWLGMCATVAWLIYRSRATRKSTSRAPEIPN
ncbi:MAG TPA: hypothetical protein VMV59_10255 [Candidatus Dormibacteraeota bacterium]|nr:hypothetical protein [Candidatus Dormibacteraeota bacterium]